jgi:hypothetical protein
MKQILIYIAIIITLPVMTTLGAVSGAIAGARHVITTWPEHLYHTLNN